MSKALDVTEIPEVLDFMNAKEELDAFKLRHEQVFEELTQLSETYNQTLQAADKKVRGLDISCGPFDRYQVAIKYDSEKLYNAIGRTEFMKIGGVVKTVAEYVIDKKSIEAAIARNQLPQEVVDVVRKVEPRYKKPDAVVLP